MTHVGGLVYSRHTIEVCLFVYTVTYEVVDCEVAYAEAGEILEEVCALAWVYTVVGQTCLDNNLCR